MKKRLIALLLVVAMLLPACVASAATWYRVNTSSLKVRFQPTDSAKILASYRRDYALTINSTKDGWSYVTFSNGYQGYVQTKYLKKGSSYKAWVSSDNTSLRKGPDGSFGATANLARGQQVTVLTHGSKYDYVSVSGFGTGYIVNSLLSKKKVKASGEKSTSTGVTGADYDAWAVRTVNLHNEASETAPVIETYPMGTKVHVISHGPYWDKVTVGGNTGWMLTSFLNSSEPAPTATPDPNGGQQPSGSGYTAYVVTANKKPVNARKGNSKNYAVQFKVGYGAAVKVLEHGKSWDYIEYNGRKGWVDNSFLRLNKPSDSGEVVPDPNVTPTPVPPFQPYTTTVKVDQLNFHKQMGDWSSNVDGVGRLNAGDVVDVLEIKGGWAHVQYNGFKGWVHKEFLN